MWAGASSGVFAHMQPKGAKMKTLLSLPEVALIAATRGMLGAGAGLLLANCLTEEKRKAVGWTLLVIGAVSTVPLAIDVFSKRVAR
jgi:hypothetical protein